MRTYNAKTEISECKYCYISGCFDLVTGLRVDMIKSANSWCVYIMYTYLFTALTTSLNALKSVFSVPT